MIALGCDHGGYELKQEIKKYLDEKGIEYKDYGCDSLDSVDYPVYAKKVAHAILDGECEKGILICGTGIGISITANKFKGIRAAVCTDCFTAEATRLHNDANILCMGGRVVGPGLAVKITDTFLNTPFSNLEIFLFTESENNFKSTTKPLLIFAFFKNSLYSSLLASITTVLILESSGTSEESVLIEISVKASTVFITGVLIFDESLAIK